MGLEMKYFVVRPKAKYADDPYARASRRAMRAYAEEIETYDPELAEDLRMWVKRTEEHNIWLRNRPEF